MVWKNLHIYVEKKSRSKFSQYFLSIVAFIESIFFPIPPDLILIPIVYFNPNKFLANARYGFTVVAPTPINVAKE